MSRGKYRRVTPKRHKQPILLLCLVALLVFAAGGTLAYLVVHTPSVENQFVPVKVKCSVGDDYTVTNTGDINAYVRAAVVVNWTDADGNIVHTAPAGASYTLSCNTTGGWSEDGSFYYYSNVVTPTGDTRVSAPVVTVTSNIPESYKLRVDVIAEAIQADGMGATSARQAWQIAASNNS